MARKQQYDWLDDPFDERKAREAEDSGMSSGFKVAAVLGCLGVLAVAVLMLIAAVGTLSMFSADLL